MVAPLAGAWIEISGSCSSPSLAAVAPLAGAWIEILCMGEPWFATKVAPLAGAWIEIRRSGVERDGGSESLPRGSVDCNQGYVTELEKTSKSLPSRERGLKSIQMLPCWVNHLVAPLAGAWIELWLEGEGLQAIAVAPLAGAWIEMIFILSRSASKVGRSPRGSVD